MSGVTGYWAYSSRDLAEPVFAAFTHSLAHRGPDGFGIEHFPEARLWLGHRRLAIMDLSERARQPMSYAEGRYWLTYNGEVYNYLELREELRGLGHRFVSESDSEVILAAYAQWGQECQFRFNGMWAFAIWDAHKRQLFLSRDRFGIKPLHYSNHAGAFVFASELKAFLTLPWIDGSFEPEILTEILGDVTNQEATPKTLLPGVLRLSAGHSMLVAVDGKIRIDPWWHTLDHLPRPRPTLEQQAEEFRDLLFDACRLRLRSKVPVATALSGGLNSSAIACTLAELNRHGPVQGAPTDWQRVVTACFTGTPFDERQFAKAIVEHTGMIPNYLDIDDKQAVGEIEKVIFDHEGIYWFPRVGATMLYRALRASGVRVCLDGEGSDGILGSNNVYIERSLEDAAVRFDLRRYWELRGVQINLTGDFGAKQDSAPSELPRFLRHLLRNRRTLQFIRPFLRHIRHRINLLRGADIAPSSDQILRHYSRLAPALNKTANLKGPASLQAFLANKFHGSELATTVASFDRSSMANGVESRLPFFDWRVVTYAFALPDTSRNGGGYTKRVLRLAMQNLMPDLIRLRTAKLGFVSPLDEWSTRGLKPWLLDICADRSFVESTIWNGPRIKQQIERAVIGKTRIVSAWPIINAYVLERMFKSRVRELASNPPKERPGIDPFAG